MCLGMTVQFETYFAQIILPSILSVGHSLYAYISLHLHNLLDILVFHYLQIGRRSFPLINIVSLLQQGIRPLQAAYMFSTEWRRQVELIRGHVAMGTDRSGNTDVFI